MEDNVYLTGVIVGFVLGLVFAYIADKIAAPAKFGDLFAKKKEGAQ